MADGPVAIVTGAAGGIGAEVARCLAADGHALALLDLGREQLDGLCKQLRDTDGVRAIGYVTDISSIDQVRQCVDEIERTQGRIESLVNCAGILRCKPSASLDIEDWNASMAVNATGVFNTLTTVVPRMAQRGRGAAVTVASNAAIVPRIGMIAYAASKAAAMMATRCIGLEYAAAGIRCNCVCPGSTDTAMLAAFGGADAVGASIQGDPGRYRLGIPLGRVASPRDIAQVVSFLLSDAARHITMENLTVDGGATLGAK